MALITKRFNGKMNLDDSAYRINDYDYIDALNVTRDSRNSAEDAVVANIVGNRLINYTLPSGVNKVIGHKQDLLRNRIYYFVWNSNGYNSILYYNGVDDTVVKLLESITDCYNDLDILLFNPSYRINHVDIIYRDEGDLLYFTDGQLNNIFCLDVAFIESFVTPTIKREYIQMAKQTSSIPPFCFYEDDVAVTVNNLRKNLFKFKVRYVYNDLTKSITSSQGVLALPVGQNLATDPASKNAKISIAVLTGEKNVTKVEILAANNIGNVFSDYYLVKSIDKAQLNLGDNEVYLWAFYNNEAYNNIDTNESILEQSLVPQTAFTQASANGNTIEYANITEGYDLQTVWDNGNNSDETSFEIDGNATIQNTLEFGNVMCYQGGNSGYDDDFGNITFVFLGNFKKGSFINVETNTTGVNYTNPSDQTASAFRSSFQTQLTLAGYTTVNVSAGGQVLIVSRANTYVTNFIFNTQLSDVNRTNYNGSMPVYDWWSRYAFGLVYFDDKDRTNGVVYPLTASVQTNGYTEILDATSSTYLQRTANILGTIWNKPPYWAFYYQVVRTKDLSKNYFVQWISDITIKEIGGSAVDNSYAYIGINPLNEFIAENPSSSFLGYSYVTKDRIRFIANGMQTNGSSTNIYTDKDFEILELATNPTINGIDYVGQYVKIILPTTSASFDFGTADFYRYFFEIYRPTVPTQVNLNLYYEFGERYMIANPTTLFRLHQGKETSQTVDINGVVTAPATFNMYSGDNYGRYRSINTQPKTKWAIPVKPFYHEFVGSETILLALNKTSVYNPIGYTISDTIFVDFPNFSTTTNTIITINDGKSHTFNISLTANLLYKYLELAAGAAYFDVKIYALQDVPSSTNVTAVLFSRDFAVNPITAPQQEFVQTSTTLVVPIGYNRIVLAVYFNGTSLQIDFNTFNLTITETSSLVKQFCIDPNYSDYFQSAVNSNGRTWIYDVNAKRQNFPSTIRFSGEFQQNTNINKTNLFYPENLDDYDRGNGAVMKMFFEGRRLYIFQQFDIGVVPVLQQIVKTASGDNLLTQNDTLLNKIQYPYQGKVGIGNVPESFAYHEYAKYGVDNNKGVVWRLSQDGIVEISNVYECDAFFSANLPAYSDTLNNGYAASGQTYLGNPTIYGGFDIYTNKYIIAMEEINRYNNHGDLIFHQDPYSIIFNESRDEKQGFECFVSFHPEGIESLGTLTVTFKNGAIWLHDSTVYNNFYGVQYDSYITQVFKGSELLKKQWASISEQASSVWDCPIIYTQANSYSNQKQESELITQDFEYLETSYEASFLRDKKSQGGLIDGDKLKGIYIVIRFRKQNATSYEFLNEVSVSFVNSPLTTH